MMFHSLQLVGLLIICHILDNVGNTKKVKKTLPSVRNTILNMLKPCMNAVVEEEVAGHEEDHEEDVPKSNCHHEDVASLKGAIW